ncbi:MAG: hypothetical protein AB1424_14625 [Thermodesulfobacteriota bacterium]
MKKKMILLMLVSSLLFLVSGAMAAEWRVPGDFLTIQAAIDSPNVNAGDRIKVAPGEHAGAFVTKGVEIKGQGGAVIASGPLHGSGLVMGFRIMTGGEGTTIKNLKFTVDLAIMNGAAQNNVTVRHCTFLNTVQAVSNWRGSGWEISHNKIIDLRTRNGGGIGILIGDFAGGTVQDNVVSHNDISGTLHVDANDGGGYNGSGIVLYADFRWGGAGTQSLTHNRVIKNKVAFASDNSSVVDVVAFEMTDTRDDPELIVITDNMAVFNDFRGTALQIDLTPDNLDQYNLILRNLGKNRGHKGHRKFFNHHHRKFFKPHGD